VGSVHRAVHPEDSDARDARSSIATTAGYRRAEDPSFYHVSGATESELRPRSDFVDEMKNFYGAPLVLIYLPVYSSL
jgi:hypothetical protein